MVLSVENKDLSVVGIFPRILKLEAEYFEWISDPDTCIDQLKSMDTGGDIFTFIQTLPDATPRYNFHVEYDSVAMLKISTYEEWWKNQINDKTRNMVRRAQKNNVELRGVEFDDEMVKGIKDIYDESPVRQGKPFRHYRKSLEELKREHGTFLDRSEFVGAFLEGRLIGFIKLVHDGEVSHLMQIISKMEHKDKAPTNALLAKAVEICAEHGVRYLHYSNWSKRGLGDFKKHHAFYKHDVPRYFVPLNLKGEVALRLGLHRDFAELLPDKVVDIAVDLRNKWNCRRYLQAGRQN